MYLHHKYGLYSSSSAINNMLCRGPNFVPIAVPGFYLSFFFLNVNMLFFNATSAKFIMVSVETYFSFRVSSLFLNADRPSPCSMFGYNPTTSIVHKIKPSGNGYNPTTSIVHKIMPSGNLGREQSFFRNLLVSLI